MDAISIIIFFVVAGLAILFWQVSRVNKKESREALFARSEEKVTPVTRFSSKPAYQSFSHKKYLREQAHRRVKQQNDSLVAQVARVTLGALATESEGQRRHKAGPSD